MRIRFLALGAVSIMITGCQSYKAQPLVPRTIYQHVFDDWSRKKPNASTIQFSDVAQWMSLNNPELQELKADYNAAKAVADIATALGNPELEVGLARGRRLDVTEASKTQPFVSLAFSFPLTRKLKHEDDLNAARAELKRTELLSRHRELYLKLRQAWVDLGLAEQKYDNATKIHQIAKSTLETGRRLGKVGSIGAVEMGLLRQNLASRKLEMLEVKSELVRAQSALAGLAGISVQRLADARVPAISPKSVPETAVLKDLMLANNGDLARVRGEHEVTERELRLEIDKQYPEVSLSPSFEQEVGEKAQVLSLGIGISIPIFDLNRQGIAAALKNRDGAATRYAAKLRALLNKLEQHQATLKLAQERQQLIKTDLLPQGQKTLQDAERALRSGGEGVDVLRFLELKEGLAELELALASAAHEVVSDVMAIEGTLGCPLLDLGDGAKIPQLPLDDKSKKGESK